MKILFAFSRDIYYNMNVHTVLTIHKEMSAVVKKENLPECPVATTVQLIGGKWKLLIMRNLLARPWRFNELRRSLAGISQKVLTDSLRQMESDGIVVRRVLAELPPSVEYSPSELGESMRPIIRSMEVWGAGYKCSLETI